MTPEQRALRSKLGAHTRWANCTDRTAATQPARDAFRDRWLDQVDPERVLPAAERTKRADHAMKAHMTRMALNSAKARARRSGRVLVSDRISGKDVEVEQLEDPAQDK